MAYVGSVEQKRQGGVDELGYRTYTRTWLVQCDSVNDGPQTVSAGVGIAHYSTYACGSETDVFAVCKTQSATLIDREKYLWNYTCNYDSKPFAFGTGGAAGTTPSGTPQPPNSQSPEMRVWEIKWGSTSNKEVLYFDYDIPSKAIRNSAGEYLAGIEVTRSIPEFTITAYTIAANFGNVALFTDTLNSAAFQGYAAKRLKCSKYTIESVYEHNAWFYKKEITVQIAPYGQTWDVKVLDQGHWERPSAGSLAGQRIKPVDAKGVALGEPFLLDGNGNKLATAAAPVYLSFIGYQVANWSTLVS